MHRHGYRGRKLQRQRDQRQALVRGLATALIENESIETTLPKAKEVVPYVEKLITQAKRGTQHSRRLVMAELDSPELVSKLFDDIVPATTTRQSGHLRLEKTGHRVGDHAPTARVSFVDDLTKKPGPKPKAKPQAKAQTAKKAKTPAKKKDA